MTLTEKLRAVLDEIIKHEIVTAAAGTNDPNSFRALTLMFHIGSATNELELGIYPGGKVSAYCYATKVEDVFVKIASYDPEEAKRLQIAKLKEELSKLEGGQ